MHDLAHDTAAALDFKMPDARAGDLSENIALALATRIDMKASAEVLIRDINAIDGARSEAIEIRDSFAHIAAEVSRKIRDIERKYWTPTQKVTQIERAYKMDEDHARLNTLADRCKASVETCDYCLRVLSDKSYRLGQLLSVKLHHTP